MKKLFFLICALVVSAGFARAQYVQPGRSYNAAAAAISPDGGASPDISGFYNVNPTGVQGQPGIAEAFTTEIQTLARGLNNDPTRIFNFVHDHIRHVLYFGSKKGAELTLLERSGNDFDQCALLVSLLEAAGFTNVGYQFGFVKAPYNSANQQDIQHWLGLSYTNTTADWPNTTNYIQGLFGQRGYYFIAQDGDGTNFSFQHVWVTLNFGGTNYILDPALKFNQPVAGINLASAMQLNTNTLINDTAGSGTTGSYYYIKGLNESALRTYLQQCSSNLLYWLSNNMPNASVQQIIGGQQIISSVGTPLSQSLIWPIDSGHTNNHPVETWYSQPTNFMSALSIVFGGTNLFWWTPQLQGQRLSLTFDTSGVANMWIEDSNVFTVTTAGSLRYTNVIVSCAHPYGSWNYSNDVPVDSGEVDDISTNTYQRTNSSYALVYAFDANPYWLQERQQRLAQYQAQGYATTSRQVTTETLNVMGLNWMVQTELALELLGQEWGDLPLHHHRFGRMAQEAGNGYYVDVYEQEDATYSSTGNAVNDFQVFDTSSYVFSAMEHGIIEQMQSSNIVGASTIKMLEIASTNNQTIYLAYNSVWEDGTYNVRSHLEGYSTTNLSAFDNVIANGGFLLIPQIGTNTVAGPGTWSGSGYVELGTVAGSRFMGMIIPAGYNGGTDSDPGASPSAATVSDNASAQFDNTDPQNANDTTANQTVAEPVRNVDGIFEMDTTDLTIGQAEPKGIHFGRHYESSSRFYNNAGMANGWVHNYYFNAQTVSAPQLGLGTTTPQQMTPMLVATRAILSLYNNNSPNPTNWMTLALISKWGIDQLINNSVSITMGKDTVQFIKQPDGSFTPPANCPMTLSNNPTGYNLTMRHGNSFRFWTNGLLTNIVDQYGNTLTISYTNNLVYKITDWTNRSLTFNYTGSTLTSVSDSTGRSVSYGYTLNASNQLDLTSFTDPDANASFNLYDSNHQMIAVSNALGQVVVSNVYDAFGRVITQYTDGNTNMPWQIYWSGFDTLVVDPMGGQQEFFFDNQSRQIGMKDALGNLWQTFYDGQDHVVTNLSPLNEAHIFIFDANNNLVETIDPLGFTNGYIYDSKFNVVTNFDSLGHTNTFGYNAQFSLLSATNQTGDSFTNGYTTSGLLSSRADAAGTINYGYDSYGQLSTIKYPNFLGTNTFINSPLGDAATNINPRGFTTAFQYNHRRQLTNTIAPSNHVFSIAYDAVGNVQSTTDGNKNVITKTWSPTRHLLTTIWPTTVQGTPIVTNSYDLRDWLFKSTDPLGYSLIYSNDTAKHLVSTVDPLFRTNTFTYDSDGRNVSSTDAAQETTRQNYDARSELIATTNAATNAVIKVFDGNGNQLFLTNLNTNVWAFHYDAANRLTNTMTPMGRSNYQAWNHVGLLQSNKDFMGQPTTFAYDGRKRMTNRTDNVGSTTFQYDYNGNQTNVIENGKTNSWMFDPYDHATNYLDSAFNQIKYGYDTNGNLTTLVYPGKGTVTYGYDALNRMTTVTDWSNRVTTYTYDLNSRVTSIARPNGTFRTIKYDRAGQTTNIIEQAANNAPIAFFVLKWNNAGRIQSEFMAPTNVYYLPPPRTNQYDADDRLTNFNSLTVSSDANGNMTSGPLLTNNTTTYVYDARNRLTSAGGINYGYDPVNNRTFLTNGSSLTQFVKDPQTAQVLIRIKNGITNYYVYGLGLIYEEDDTTNSSKIVTYHYDYRGSTIALTDSNGIVTDQIQYAAYGMTTLRTNIAGGTPFDTPFLFNGGYGIQTDPNGLLYMRARYYNPYICRFINPDPSGWKGGLNFYAFAAGNPLSYWDPSGLGPAGTTLIPIWADATTDVPLDPDNPFSLYTTQATFTSGAIGTAGVLELAAQVRDNYNAAVAELTDDGSYSAARDAIRDFYNQPENSTPLAQGLADMYRWEQGLSGETSSMTSPTVTSAAVNSAAAWATWGGRGVMVIGVAADTYEVATAPNTSLALTQVGSATVGGTGGALAGATIGATIGSIVPGPGTAIGALIGAFAGGILGGAGGHWLGTAAYQSVYGFDP